MTQALAGLKILDFTTTIAGPHCTRMLADLGAEIIKIESPEGDMMRARPPQRNGASTMFGQLNAGKRSLALDLKTPQAVAVVRRLAATSDVVVENFRPGVMRRFGLDYAALSALRPELVYCAISGYGQTGPSADLPAYAPVIHAASGYDLAHLAYQEPGRKPDYCGIYIADVLTGTYAFGAVMTALYQRRETGRGQMIDVSMLESMLSLSLQEMQAAQFPVPLPSRPLFGPIAARDGYIMLAIASERTFQNLSVACGREDWQTDPRFEKYPDRRAHWAALMDEVEAWSGQHGVDEILACLARHNVPSSPYRTVQQAMADPQIDHRHALAEVRDAGGVFKALNPPFRFSDAAVQAGGFVSATGENSRTILSEAGYSDAEIDSLIRDGVVPVE